jgi:hypothetical protein
MDVWLQTERTAKSDSFRLRLARSPQQATAMSQNNAREAMQGAKRDYPEYTWEMESGFSSGEFILHGQNKDKSSRKIVPVMPRRETSDSLRRQIDELRVEAARLLSESEKTKRAAEKLAERIERLEKTAI